MTPSIMARYLLRPSRLQDADLAGVADHEAVGHGERLAVGDHAVAPDEAVGHARAQATDAAVLEDDGVFDLGVLDDDAVADGRVPVSYTHLRAHETDSYLVCRLLLEKKKKN